MVTNLVKTSRSVGWEKVAPVERPCSGQPSGMAPVRTDTRLLTTLRLDLATLPSRATQSRTPSERKGLGSG